MKTNNFSKFSWQPCEIFHNTAYAYTSRCIIGVPVYKSKLNETEKASLNQLCKVIGHSYEICLICPDNIELNDYIDIAYSNGVYLSYLFCGNEYFKSTETYSYMLETPDFYKCFNEYDYLMIYQLDGWIFVNFLDYYLDLNVDYIGSPWRTGILHFNEDTVGNGGVSLRRVQKFIDICSKFTNDDYLKPHIENEDLFFCKTMRKKINLKFPNIKNASNFSLQSDWHYFINKYNDKHLPMCLHAWHRDYSVLKKYIKIEYDNSKHLTNDIITYDNLINYQKFKNLNFINRKTIKIENKNINQEKQKEKIENTKTNKKITKNFFSWTSYIKNYHKTNNAVKQKNENDKQFKIIVTMTSWKGRINYVKDVLISMLNNTIMPDKIIINLSTDEFVKKENELPNDLVQLINDNKMIININWVKENNKQFKKLIPTLKLYPNDIIISIDDDFIYNINFIETLYNDFKKYNYEHPITTWENTKMTNAIYGNLYTHMGGGTITMLKFYNNYIFDIYENLVKEKLKNNIRVFDDTVYTYSAYLNNSSYKLSSKPFRSLIKNAIITDNGISKNNINELKQWHNDIRNYIRIKYNMQFTNGYGFKPISNNDITFIIPNRGGKHIDTVINNFKTTFQKQFNNINFIVIEQCDNELFVRGQLYNIAFNYVNSKYIALIDNDIYNFNTFNIIEQYEKFNGPYVAFDEITQISLNENNTNYTKLKSEKRYAGFGAFSVMKYEDFEKVNGFSNLCFGWGAEDNILNEKLKFKRMIHILGHITHQRRNTQNIKATQNNQSILSKYKYGEIKYSDDGYKQTTYNVIYDKINNNIRYIGVNNISVVNSYKYMNEYINSIKIINNK